MTMNPIISFPNLIRVAENVSYTERPMRKSNGKIRIISEPNPQLMETQDALLKVMEASFTPHPASHAFTKGRNPHTAVMPHVKKHTVLTLDIKDFFPSVPEETIRSAIQELIMPIYEAWSVMEDWLLQDTLFKIITWRGKLPQGAPTSPLISNYAFTQYDKFFASLPYVTHAEVTYTRYADDLIFSFDDDTQEAMLPKPFAIGRWQSLVEETIRPTYRVNPNKITCKRFWERQEILGIVVNERATVNRELKNRLRGFLHHMGYRGLPLDKETEGMLSYINSVDPEAYKKLKVVYDKAKRS